MIHERELNGIVINEIKRRISLFVNSSEKSKIENLLNDIYLGKFKIEEFKRKLSGVNLERTSDEKFYREEDVEKNINELLRGI